MRMSRIGPFNLFAIPGAAEWAGLALSLATLLALSAWGVRMRRA
jgi:hypothetical protein